jgi:hypothetical protein
MVGLKLITDPPTFNFPLSRLWFIFHNFVNYKPKKLIQFTKIIQLHSIQITKLDKNYIQFAFDIHFKSDFIKFKIQSSLQLNFI